MRQDEFETFSAMLESVADYCGRKLSPGVIAIYWQGLQDLDIQVVRQALNAHVQNPDQGQFMPKIADIRRMIGGTTRDAALMAWNKVCEAVSRAGAYASVCFDDPIINRVMLDMGGWPQHCAKAEDELPFVERNFCDRYRAYRARGGKVDHPAYLVGISESQNAQAGFESPAPMLIGSEEAAGAVLTGGSRQPMIPVTSGDYSRVVIDRLTGPRQVAA